MFIGGAYIRLSVALALMSVTLSMTSAYGQSPANPPGSPDNDVAAAQGSQFSKPEKKFLPEKPRPIDREEEVATVMADNAAVREQLRKMEEQQRTLLELVDQLQRRLDGSTVAEVARPAQPPGPAEAAASAVPLMEAADASAISPSAPQAEATSTDDRYKYKEGIVLAETSEDAKIPFQLKFTNITQFRYLNTLSSNDTFTSHLGNVLPINKRNDLTVNREMFTFAGYIFDQRLTFGLFAWTSATTTQVVVSGNVSWRFNKAITLNSGYWAVPGSRTLTYTFPYFTQPERSLADNFFRPGFTQGIWFTGEPVKGLNYDVFIGDGLNTLTIPVSKIDTHLAYAASVWWEPLGPFGPDGKSRNMYDDYFRSKKPVIRVGTSYTRSREDRFTNLDQSNPENTSMHNSDGVLTFSTGAFAPGVTLDLATYRMLAIDGGIKWQGLAVNGQYYFRWVNDFVADGPLPLSSTFDQGGELSVSYFVVPKKWMVYGRTSGILGQFGNSSEYAGGFKWYFVPTQRVWFQGEALRLYKSAYGSTITPYTAGMSGWIPVVQTIFSF
jgi:hypothetical protein